MRWVQLINVDNGARRLVVCCGLTKLNGVKCLVLGNEPTIEYVAMRNVVAVGPKFEFDLPCEGKPGKKDSCGDDDCWDIEPVPSDYKEFSIQ